MPKSLPDAQADPTRTIDQPSAPATVRAEDTAFRTGHPDAPPDESSRTAAYVPSEESSRTGAYVPSDVHGDASSATGGFTPSDLPKRGPREIPTVRGYEIVGELGRGGMGVVYKAKQVGLDRLVALKMILAGAHARPKDLDRFRAEAQAVARFQHPNIVQIYEVGDADGLPYFSLEFVPGGTLADKVHREPQPAAYAAGTVEALARAMQYAHEHGVVHRDLKPANVLLAPDGTPKVTDFGLAKRLEQDSGQTQAGTVLGTPSYMAPEQAMGADQAGPQADVYALGAILYDLLTGRPPFAGSSVLDTLEMVRTREPVPPGQLTAKLPKDLETICLKCLHKEPSRRYSTAGELADDLRRYLDGRPILARPVGALERAWRWAKRNPTVAGLGSATAVSILAVAIVTSVLSYQLNQKRNEAEANFQAARIAKENEEAERKKAEENARLAKLAEEKETKEREKAEAARRVRDDQALLALSALRGTSIYVDQVMSRKASLRPLRLQIQKVTLNDLEKLRAHMAKNPLEGRTEAGAYQRMGEVYLAANKVQEAADVVRKAHAVTEKFMADNPTEAVGPRNLAAISNMLGDVELRLGDAEAARKRYAEGLALRRQWTKMLPPDQAPTGQQAVAKSHELVGLAHLQLGEPKAALDSFREALAEYDRLPPKVAGDLDVRRERLTVRDHVGDCLYRLGDSAKAEAEYRAVFKERTAIRDSHLEFPQLNVDVANSHNSLGDFYLFDRQDALRALTHYQVLYESARKKAAEDPDDLVDKRNLATVEYRLGYAFGRLADQIPAPPGAVPRMRSLWHYQNCLRTGLELAAVDRADTRAWIDVMLVRARLGQADQAAELAETLLAKAGKDRRLLFQTACGLAIAGGGTGPAAERCRTRAVEVIDRLIQAGWKDRVGLEHDPDLESIRGDKKFGELVKQMPKP